MPIKNNGFIFISYAHKDGDIVLPIIEKLQERFNVWYDKGIRLGKEWDDEITEHLNTCSIFIYMVSSKSLKSTNCKDEIAYARDSEIPFINIFIEDIKLEGTFKLRYGRYQMCYLKNYPNLDLLVDEVDRSIKGFNVNVYKQDVILSLDKKNDFFDLNNKDEIEMDLIDEEPEEEKTIVPTKKVSKKKAVNKEKEITNKKPKTTKKEPKIIEEPSEEKEVKNNKKKITPPLNDFKIQKGVLKAYYGEYGNIIIPKEITSIAPNAFSSNYRITSVTIPNNVTSIGHHAFKNCQNLVSISIGSGITSISENTFEGCIKLKSVKLGNGLLIIKASAFKNCKALETINLFDSIIKIEEYAFYQCISLKKIHIPMNLTSISHNAFQGCKILGGINLPEKLKTIEMDAFRGCISLKSIVIPDKVNKIDTGSFANCRNLTSVTIGKKVLHIYGGAFSNCKKIDKVINRSILLIKAGSKRHGEVALYATSVTKK